MPIVTVRMGKKTVQLPLDSACMLDEAIARAGFSMPLLCAGNHTCGRCRVHAYGALSRPDEEEKRLLAPSLLLDNVRLACCARVLGDCAVQLPEPVQAAVRLTGEGAGFSGPPSFQGAGWALAADIGTTTVAVYLLSLSGGAAGGISGCILGAAGAPSAQAAYGADVISRIQAAQADGGRALQGCILSQLDSLIAGLLRAHSIPPAGIAGVVLTGNTVMLHLAAGLNPAGLGAYPFEAESLFGIKYAARALLRAVSPSAEVYFSPCVGGYIGGDLINAALACALAPGELLLDIGTNGEMALATENGLLCCSTAAGPAFEGVNLRCGMSAAPGAIVSVRTTKDGGLLARTMNGEPPTGVCGAGAISALAALRRLELVDETGRLAQAYQQTGFPLAQGVLLTQPDIRQLQLAKAAIAAGVDALLYHADWSEARIGRVWLAGGFGAAIDPAAAAAIGMIPPALASRTRAAGNAAGMGGCAAARWQSAIDEDERLAAGAVELPLSTDRYFNERYIEQMML